MENTRRTRGTVVALATAFGAVVFLGHAATAAPSAAGTLNLQTSLRVASTPVQCPQGAPAEAAECRTRTGEALVQGLGSVSEAYLWSYGVGPPTCPSPLTAPLATSGRLVVVGKGEIHFQLAQGTQCVGLEPVRNEPQNFTITGGTGRYESAYGSGRVERLLSAGSGTETWTGTLVVPGLEFDLTPPTLSGATAKTVRAPRRAKRVRVTYNVTASDAVDGPIAVSCSPRSGTRFPIGRSIVTCEATDSSANTTRARFVVTVKKTR
jgi:HYR domain